MDAWVPFFQTLLWVLLIGGAFWLFHTQVKDVLEAIRDRVRKGSTIKAGWFELGESPPAQSESSQKRELIEEAREATDSIESQGQGNPALQTQALLAEDLAVRELQTEFGVSINRHVAVGRDFGLDGLFAKDGRGYGIEIKLTKRPLREEAARAAIERLERFTSRFGWRRFSLVLVEILLDEDVDTVAEKRRIDGALQDSSRDVIVRVYSFQPLARKYGITKEDVS